MMNNRIEISRETKVMLLKVLQNGYFELADLENLAGHLYSNVSDEELDRRISELERKLGKNN